VPSYQAMTSTRHPQAAAIAAKRSLVALVLGALLGITFVAIAPAAPAEAAVTATASQGAAVAKFARANMVGATYGSFCGGGPSVDCFVCSGGVFLAWNNAAPGMVRRSSASGQYGGTGQKIRIGSGGNVDTSKIRPGDILFWSNNGKQSGIYHNAIYLGKGEILQTGSVRGHSWIGSVNDDKSRRMPYALRPGPYPNLTPVAENLSFAYNADTDSFEARGSVRDPDSWWSELNVRLEDRWFHDTGSTAAVVNDVADEWFWDTGGNSFAMAIPRTAQGRHTITVMARDADTGGWFDVGAFVPDDFGLVFEGERQLTNAEVAEYVYRVEGEPPSEVGPLSGFAHGAALNWLLSEGHVDSFTGSLAPTNQAERAWVADLIFSVAGEPSFSAPGAATFSDVPLSHSSSDAVEWLASLGLDGPDGGDIFVPTGVVTKEQLFIMLYLVAGEPTASPPDGWTVHDVAVDDPAYLPAQWADSAGWFDEPADDLKASTLFGGEIRWLFREGIELYEPGFAFAGHNEMTRETMALFLQRITGASDVVPATATFTDVPLTHRSSGAIEWFATTGITEGYEDGTFRPDTGVSRQAMAAFIYRHAGEPDFTAPSTPSFPDTPTSHPFFFEVEWLATTGITGGYTDNTFRPGTFVARQAMAAFLYRYAMLD
jgi:cell wall-associated NlpC family hydrolase